MSRPLNYRERRFVELYAVSGNGRQSYIDAGYSVNGAHQGASRLLSRSAICEAIEALKPPAVKVEDLVTPDYVLAGLRREAETGETSSSRTAALTQLGRALGLFVDNNKVMTTTTYADELENLADEIQKRVEEHTEQARETRLRLVKD